MPWLTTIHHGYYYGHSYGLLSHPLDSRPAQSLQASDAGVMNSTVEEAEELPSEQRHADEEPDRLRCGGLYCFLFL